MPAKDIQLIGIGLYQACRMKFAGHVTRDPTADRLSLIEWGERFLSHYFTLPSSRMHRWLAERLDRLGDNRGSKINLLGPRGNAKSTLATLAYVLRRAVETRDQYIWIVSDTWQQAHRHLSNIKAELIDNRELAKVYPFAGRGPVWRRNGIELTNGVVIEALGVGNNLRGHRNRENRPMLIICDDIQNDRQAWSAQQRMKIADWFHGTLMNAGSPWTNVVNLSTALHREALSMELCRRPGWESETFQAIRTWPTATSLWHQWERLYCNPDDPDRHQTARRFYEANRAAMDAGAEVLWPELEDLYSLMSMRVDVGRVAFEREKQNSPVSPDECEFPEAYFDETIWFEKWPENLKVKTMALDPSKGTDARWGDYSAMVMLGVDTEGTFYVEADLARRATPEVVARGVELYRDFRPDGMAVESNQYQDLLAGSFEEEFRRQSVLAPRPYSMDNRVNKRVRIRRIGPYLSSRRLRFKGDSASTRLLVEQLKDFPAGQHDDGPDALEMALRLAHELLIGAAAPDDLGDRLIA